MGMEASVIGIKFTNNLTKYIVRCWHTPVFKGCPLNPHPSSGLSRGCKANTIRWPNVGLLLARRLRRRPNIKPTSVQRILFAGYKSVVIALVQIWSQITQRFSEFIPGILSSQDSAPSQRKDPRLLFVYPQAILSRFLGAYNYITRNRS